MSDDVLYERQGHVRLITINRPERMNSMDFAANDVLIERWKEFEADDDARVAVVTGAGERAFCAGADLKTYTMDYATTPVPEFRRRFTNGPGFGGITRNLPVFKPIVAAVNGYAVSGGSSSPSRQTFASAHPAPGSDSRTPGGASTPAMVRSFASRRSSASATRWR